MNITVKHVKRKGYAPSYPLELEYLMAEVFGIHGKYYGTAGSFSDARAVRGALKELINMFRKRSREITADDDRLRFILENRLARLHKGVNRIKSIDESYMEILIDSLLICANLLGYDWKSGKPNRTIIYYQTDEQRQADYRSRGVFPSCEKWKAMISQKKSLVKKLHEGGLSVNEIALVTGWKSAMIHNVVKAT